MNVDTSSLIQGSRQAGNVQFVDVMESINASNTARNQKEELDEMDMNTTQEGIESFVTTDLSTDDSIYNEEVAALIATESIVSGIMSSFESLIDGGLRIGCTIASKIIGIFDEEHEKGFEAFSNVIIDIDWSSELESNILKAIFKENVDQIYDEYESAFDVGHIVGNIVGNIIPMMTGVKEVTEVVSALSSFSSSYSLSIENGATQDQAIEIGLLSAALGAITGFGLEKIGKVATSSKTIGDLLKSVFKGGAIASIEPFITSLTQYVTFAYKLEDSEGNRIYKNFMDYYKSSGGMVNTAVSAALGSTVVGLKSVYGIVSNTGERVTLDQLKFSDDELMMLRRAKVSDYTSYQENLEQISKIVHSKYDKYFGTDYVNEVLSKINFMDMSASEMANKFNKSGNLYGMVDEIGNVFISNDASTHDVIHELEHKFSQNVQLYTIINGKQRAVTGIREYFEDGFHSNYANEALTDFLSFKDQGFLGNSPYSHMFDATKVSYVSLWDRIDDSIVRAYGEQYRYYLDYIYMTNDTAALRQFFDSFAGVGSYDSFIRSMVYNGNMEELETIVSTIEKNTGLKPESSSIIESIRKLFR